MNPQKLRPPQEILHFADVIGDFAHAPCHDVIASGRTVGLKTDYSPPFEDFSFVAEPTASDTPDSSDTADVDYKALFAASPVGMIVTGPSHMVEQWNSAASELTGIDASEAVGRVLPFACPTADSGSLPVTGVNGVTLAAAGRSLGHQHIVSLFPTAEVSNDRLTFLAAKSHELKTPLTVITSFVRVLLGRHGTETDDAERRLVALEAINDGADELANMLEKLLLSSRPHADRVEIDPAPCDLRRLLIHSVTGFDIASERHQLSLDVDDHLPQVLADDQAIKTVIGQLLENAIKYSPDGGEITLAAHPHPTANEVVVSVADLGIGLSEEDADRVFEPFFQGGVRELNGIRGGVGLGLSIVARLVADHGGRFWADGEPDIGSTFSFTLPVVELHIGQRS